MNRNVLFLTALAAALAAGPARAEDPAAEAAAPADEAAGETPTAKPEPAPAPKPPAPKETAQPKAAAAAKPAAKAEAPAAELAAALPGPDERAMSEWKYLRTLAEDKSEEVAQSVAAQLAGWLSANGGRDYADEAKLVLASIRVRLGDWRSAAVDLLKLLYENPQSKLDFQAKRALTEIVEKRMDRKLRPVFAEIARGTQEPDKTARLAKLLARLADQAGDALYEPLSREFIDFLARHPAYAKADELELQLGQLHDKAERFESAILAFNKVAAVYPASPLCPKALRLTGDVYAGRLKDYAKAVDAYQGVTQRFASSPEAGVAYEAIAAMEERQKRYELALEVYDKIVAVYPGQESAQRSLQAKARILKERLSRPEDSIKAQEALADMFKGSQAAAEALNGAAETAHKLKEYAMEVRLYERIYKECAQSELAPQAWYAAAEVVEEYITNFDLAEKIYSELAQRFPGHKLGKKARGRAQSLAKKRGR